jgi:hypothetical protein
MIRAWRAWVELWDRREPPTALAMVRIALAIVMLADFATIWRLDLIDALFAPPPAGFATATSWLSPFAMWLAATLALVAIAIGLATRVACVVFVAISARLAQLAPDADRGIDTLVRVTFAILALSRCNARWSVDAWLARRLGRPMPAEGFAWPRYLLLLQLVWVYFSGGMNKSGAEWGPLGGFSALANALADPHMARFDPGWVAPIHPLTQLATALTMCFELGAPLYLAFYYFAETRDRPGRLRRVSNRLRLRWVWIGLGVGFHLGIAIGLRLGVFPWGMLALYPVLLRPDELRRTTTSPPSP